MLKTVDVALTVIQMFTKNEPEWSGSELAHKMNLDHAKIYRILETFESRNFLQKDPITKKYSLGFAAWELGMAMYDRLNVKEFIQPILEELFQQTEESVFLTLLDKDEAVTFEAIEPDNKVKFSVTVGSRAPLYVGASYRSILAFMSEEFINSYLTKSELKQYTEKTMTNPEEIKRDLNKIRQQGWAVSEGEYTPDIIAIAVPVFDQHNKIIGSLTISGPIYRMTEEKRSEFISLLEKANRKLADVIYKFPLKIRA
ncbi:IclR family transcriptional regulator [Peribacillus sp. JNUCC 23]